MTSLAEELREWAKTHERDTRRGTLYWWSMSLPTLDINRELLYPGTHTKFPEGAVGVRTDDDFFAVAVLPWKFLPLSTLSIVEILWPSVITDPRFDIRPDTVYKA